MVPDTPAMQEPEMLDTPPSQTVYWPLAQQVSSIRLINGGFSDRSRGGQPHAEVRSMEGEAALKAVTVKADVGS